MCQNASGTGSATGTPGPTTKAATAWRPGPSAAAGTCGASSRANRPSSSRKQRGNGAMKVRLMGLEEECRAAVEALQAVLDVVEIDGPYPNRGDSKLVRFYVETRGAK